MKTIPQSFGTTDRHYELAQRSAHVALYRVYRQTSSDPGPLLGYEVHVIRFRPESQLLGKTIEAYERLASNEDFGKWAWSFGGTNALARALELFNGLQETPAAVAPAGAGVEMSSSPYADPLAPPKSTVEDMPSQDGHTVRPIPDTFKKNGYSYRLLRRSERVCIYEQWQGSGRLAAYEVMIIRIDRARKCRGRNFPETERLGSNEDWGKYGWTFSVGMHGPAGALDLAVRRFDELQQRGAKVSPGQPPGAIPPEPIPDHTPDALPVMVQQPGEPAGLPALTS